MQECIVLWWKTSRARARVCVCVCVCAGTLTQITAKDIDFSSFFHFRHGVFRLLSVVETFDMSSVLETTRKSVLVVEIKKRSVNLFNMYYEMLCLNLRN